MKYLCLVYFDERKLDALSKSEYDTLVAEVLAYREVLRKSGHYIVSDGLQSTQTATTIRIRNGKVLTTDGPFAETAEQLGGFMLIEARASRIPPGSPGVHRGAAAQGAEVAVAAGRRSPPIPR
jgi:hypothetical protein